MLCCKPISYPTSVSFNAIPVTIILISDAPLFYAISLQLVTSNSYCIYRQTIIDYRQPVLIFITAFIIEAFVSAT